MNLLPLLLAAAGLANATSLDGLRLHLGENKDRYKEAETKMRSMGLIPREDKRDTTSDEIFLGQMKDERQAPSTPAGAPPASATKSALQRAQALSGKKAEDVADIPEDSLAEFDPVTGEKLVKSEGEILKAVIEDIAARRCKAPSAAGSFKALLWGAAVLDARSREGQKWPQMKQESKALWEQLAKAVSEGRTDILKNGRPSGRAGEHLPTINYKEQKELGATATWDGNINVGDIFAGLSGPGKNAVLFHEYLHDTDDATHSGINNNFWNGQLPEPDETPSGKNWTETLAYRQMGDWADVLNLPWPKSLNN